MSLREDNEALQERIRELEEIIAMMPTPVAKELILEQIARTWLANIMSGVVSSQRKSIFPKSKGEPYTIEFLDKQVKSAISNPSIIDAWDILVRLL